MKIVASLAIAAVLSVPALAGQRDGGGKGLTVHEWGTFLTMSGSNGVTLDGMYHEEHALPGFVHSRAKDQLRIQSALTKGETPVIYFYTDQFTKVDVRVDFPGGVWTQWYPQARHVGPGIAASGSPPPVTKGHIEWSAQIIPAKDGANPPLSATSSDALWNHARQVDAAYVRTAGPDNSGSGAENERFLFYRGLGSVDMPLDVSAKGNGILSLSAGMEEPVRHLFVLRVENGRGAYRYLESLKPGGTLQDVIPAMNQAKPMAEFTRSIADDLAGRLAQSGLYAKEARAMVNTWKTSYFGSDGIRVLYVLPQSWTDRFIPMKIEPRPENLVRVMVGRTELLTPDRENRAQAAVKDLASPSTTTREKAYGFLREQGRYVEPILRYVSRTTTDPQVRSLCTRLLLAESVTELRTATRAASDGSKLVEKPAFVRAQLASLLREVGLNKEAEEEGRQVIADLDRMQKPADENSGARHHLRAYARAAEAIGDDRMAADRFARFVKFGSQSKTCGGCHFEEGPRNMAWYRDWWAGKRYAAAIKRLGATESAIRQHRDRLSANPNDTAAQMMLAYLLQDRGEESQVAALWSSVEGKPVRAASLNPGAKSKVDRTRSAALISREASSPPPR